VPRPLGQISGPAQLQPDSVGTNRRSSRRTRIRALMAVANAPPTSAAGNKGMNGKSGMFFIFFILIAIGCLL
jgi:hypothetical protein